MTHRFARLLAGGLALAAGLGSPLSASFAPGPGTIAILIDGTARSHYRHAGRWYVEALEGREYAIRLHNPYDVRVAVALSVDGLNTIDARDTTAAAARKWVIGPRQTVVISGWQTSRRDARRFEFTTESRSYGEALGKTANLGIISAAFFRERARPGVSTSDDVPARGAERQAPSAPAAAAEAGSAAPAGARKDLRDEYAATGMGRRTDHAVTQVWLDLEETPAHTVDIRYEFRPQLVRLGILPAPAVADPLARRERARGFEPGFAPDPGRR